MKNNSALAWFMPLYFVDVKYYASIGKLLILIPNVRGQVLEYIKIMTKKHIYLYTIQYDTIRFFYCA